MKQCWKGNRFVHCRNKTFSKSNIFSFYWPTQVSSSKFAPEFCKQRFLLGHQWKQNNCGSTDPWQTIGQVYSLSLLCGFTAWWKHIHMIYSQKAFEGSVCHLLFCFRQGQDVCMLFLTICLGIFTEVTDKVNLLLTEILLVGFKNDHSSSCHDCFFIIVVAWKIGSHCKENIPCGRKEKRSFWIRRSQEGLSTKSIEAIGNPTIAFLLKTFCWVMYRKPFGRNPGRRSTCKVTWQQLSCLHCPVPQSTRDPTTEALFTASIGAVYSSGWNDLGN